MSEPQSDSSAKLREWLASPEAREVIMEAVRQAEESTRRLNEFRRLDDDVLRRHMTF